MGKLVGFLFVLIVLAAMALGGGWYWLNTIYTGKGPATGDGKPRVVMVERGATSQGIATKLKEAGAIQDAEQFRLALRMREFLGEKPVMKAGEYELPSAASMEAIVKELSVGSPLQYAVIVPEGLSVSQIVSLLQEREWKATGGPDRSYKLVGEVPSDIAEGSLLPGDYAVSRNDTVASVIERMQKAQKALLADLWEKREIAPLIKLYKQNPVLGAVVSPEPVKTPQDAIILASVIEKETGNADEQSKVSAAMIGRLATGMRLQVDATIVYGLTKGAPLGRALTTKEIHTKTAWNTYEMDGLPSTPICNPGAGAIAAALKPALSPARYFMADGTGGHLFAESYAEHQKNVDAYWKLRKANEAAGVNTPAVKPTQ